MANSEQSGVLMPFAPVRLLAPVIPAPPPCGGRHTLTVHRYVLGRRLARLRPRLLHQCIAYLGKHTSLLPPPKVVVDGLPRGQVVGELRHWQPVLRM